MIVLERVQGVIERTGHGANLAQLFFRHMVQVVIHRAIAMFAGFNLALDAIKTGHQQSGERQVRIRSWIGWAELDTFGGWAVCQWDAHGGAAVALREDQVDGSLEARNQPLVAVGCGSDDCQQGGSVRQQSTDIVAGGLGETRIAFHVKEQGLFALPQALMYVHAGTVVSKDWLGHEGDRFTIFARGVLHYIFVKHDVISGLEQGIEPDIDLGLSRAANFMVLGLNQYAIIFEQQCHLAADILECIVGGNGEVSFLYAHTMTKVSTAIARAVPLRFVGVNLRILDVGCRVVSYIVENEKFRFGTEVAGTVCTGRAKEGSGLCGNK